LDRVRENESTSSTWRDHQGSVSMGPKKRNQRPNKTRDRKNITNQSGPVEGKINAGTSSAPARLRGTIGQKAGKIGSTKQKKKIKSSNQTKRVEFRRVSLQSEKEQVRELQRTAG